MKSSCSLLTLTFLAGIAIVRSDTAAGSDQIPGPPQTQPIALVNGVLHPVTGPVIEGGMLVFDEGEITEISRRGRPPAEARVIDLQGRHVYPGLIEAHSQLGLTEVASIRASRDYAEAGEFNPNVSAHMSVNPDSELIPVTRSAGVLLALTAPSSGVISGRAAVLQLDGWTYEDLTLQPDAAMMVNWPRITPYSFRGVTRSRSDQDAAREREMQELRDFFDDARAWLQSRDADPDAQRYDIRFAAMADVLAGRVPLMVEARRAMEIQSAVAFAAEQGVKIIIFGGQDAMMCVPLLRQYDVPVVVSAVHRNPLRRHEDYDVSYTLPKRLHEAGIRFCISGSDRSETWNARNLGHHAATAAAWGLPKDEALKAVTISAAEILGIADRVGSLEAGKHATLFVSDADPLDTEVTVSHAWIQGRAVDLSNRHTDLYDKYRRKYRQLKRERRR